MHFHVVIICLLLFKVRQEVSEGRRKKIVSERDRVRKWKEKKERNVGKKETENELVGST